MKSSEAAEREACSPVVFVFLDAWTLVTGRQAAMVGRMVSHGFRLLDFEFKTLSEADAEEIYRTNHPIREGNSWHVARLVYPMGRSLGLLFGVGDPSSCACERMQRLKGKANPALNKPGQLRYDFLAPNRCLSLMHSSDNLSQCRREGAVFFTSDRIEQACRSALDGTVSSGGPMRELTQASSEMGLERIDEPGLGTLFARIRLRITKELERLCSAVAARTALASYRAHWEALSRGTSRDPVVTEASRYLRLVAREKPLLEAITGAFESASRLRGVYAEYYRPPAHEPLSLVRCLQVLNTPAVYPRWDAIRQLPDDMLFDPWEWLLFRTHLFNFDDLLSATAEVS
jgi:nucleoside diphosphate kinase